MPAAKIPVILITGFLGSGKTTLLNRLLTGSPVRKIGLLINDFGKIAVDGRLLLSLHPEVADGKVYEIANGSIFCSCLTSSFIAGLRHFASERPEVLYIETSGMSDPSTMGRLLAESGLSRDFDVTHTVCVADPVRTPKLLGTLEAVKKQIAAATHIIINKADLVDEARLAEVSSVMRAINPGALMTHAVQADCGPDFLAPAPRRQTLLSGKAESCNTPGNRPRSILLRQCEISRPVLEAYLGRIAEKVLRLKGFFEIGGALYYVSDTGNGVSIQPADTPADVPRGISVLCDPAAAEDVIEGWKAAGGG